MLIVWIVLGIVGLIVVSFLIWSVIWVRKLTHPELAEQTTKQLKDRIRLGEDRIQQGEERIRHGDGSIQKSNEYIRQCKEMIARDKKAGKNQQVLEGLIARNVFGETEMKEITVLVSRGTALVERDRELSMPIGVLTDESTKMTKRSTNLILTVREKKRDEVQPELDELDAKIPEIDAQINELRAQQQARQPEIMAMYAEVEKWIAVGQSRL